MTQTPSTDHPTPSLSCRFCATPLEHTFVDLGMSPLANAYLTADALARAESFYPLHVRVCHQCFLVQLPEVESPEAIFSDYAYFSSYSETWLAHAKAFAAMTLERFGLDGTSRVIEAASNDGYLLRFFAERGVPVLGIEPAANVAAAAEELGIETRVEFFGVEAADRLVEDGLRADLLVGNNVYAHTPHLNDFTAGLARTLAPEGVISLEFPHVLQLIDNNQFDTIYHEHFSYFSLGTVAQVFEAHGLRIFDVEELPTHGGSLRVFGCHRDSERPTEGSVQARLDHEAARGLRTLEPYLAFGERVKATKRRLLEFLVREKDAGRRIVGYGAPAKGNTLLNYCGVGTDFLDFTVDRSPHKQGHYLPGTHIPIHAPDRIRETRPDIVLILPWNLHAEIRRQMADVTSWGGRFAVAIPEVEVLP